jgi:hypothetical protein
MAQVNIVLVADGRKRRGRPEMKWEKEAEGVMKRKNLTRADKIKRQTRRNVTENQSVMTLENSYR